MSNKSTDVWKKRWDALEQMLQADDRDAKDAHRYETLKSVRRCLYAFGRSHYDFFKSGFEGDNGISLEPSPDYPKEYVLSAILQQISFDLDVIGRAIHYRLPTALRDARDTLDKADILAYTALKPAIKANLLPDMTVVTYFQKSVSVHIMPYAPVALIGIPFSAIDNPCDLLAIPHEVGHYVYRHGIFQDQAHKGNRFEAVLRNQLAGRPQWLLNWVEEIFADVYGCLVAGPVIALSFQDLQAEYSLEDFVSEDGEHPTPALRPNVYQHVLKHGNWCAEATQALESNWAQYLAKRPVLGALKFGGAGVAGQLINVDEVNTQMAAVVDKMMDEHLKILAEANHTATPNEKTVWMRDDLAKGELVGQLYDKFTARVDGMANNVAAVVPELVIHDADKGAKMRLETPKADATAKPIERKPGETGLWIDALKASKGSGRTLTMPVEIWTALLMTNGWATEGPGANSH